jgi:beta-glucoside operon transcriptional antiterminator
VKKIYNNNVALVLNGDGHEEIVMGKGIGFQLKSVTKFDEQKVKIDKTFVVEKNADTTNLPNILSGLNYQDILLASNILQFAEKKLGHKFTAGLLVALADHISFMLKRVREGQFFNAPLEWDIKALYPDEYAVSEEAVKIIRIQENVMIPDQEAAFIALHFINADYDNKDMQETMFVSKVVQNVLNIATYHYGDVFDTKSYNFARFLTHMRYFVIRQIRGEVLDADSSILNVVSKQYSNDYSCALKIQKYLYSNYKWQINSSELLYLTLYLNRLSATNK